MRCSAQGGRQEVAGLERSGLKRLADAEKRANSLESRFDLAYNAAHALCLVTPGEMSVFVRSPLELPRARVAVEAAGLPVTLLDDDVKTARDRVSVGTMYLSKGLEFRAVAVMACDDEVLPLQARIETVTDEGDLEEVYDTERHLLYVACTRARDHLLVTGVSPASEFLEDLRG